MRSAALVWVLGVLAIAQSGVVLVCLASGPATCDGLSEKAQVDGIEHHGPRSSLLRRHGVGSEVTRPKDR